MTKAKKKPREAVTGSYTPAPHVVLDSAAFVGASERAKALLWEFFRQHNGSNNGHLHATETWLATRGWKSHDAIASAVSELLERGLIVQTKQGGLGIGPSYFAMTWLHITSFVGLDISPKSYWPGAWAACTVPPKKSRRRVEKRKAHPDSQGNATPTVGVGESPTTPVAGAKTALSDGPATPAAGDNECCQFHNAHAATEGTVIPLFQGTRQPATPTTNRLAPLQGMLAHAI
jgi:hypothetical protein